MAWLERFGLKFINDLYCTPKGFYTQFWHAPCVKIRNLYRRLSLRARKTRPAETEGREP